MRKMRCDPGYGQTGTILFIDILLCVWHTLYVSTVFFYLSLFLYSSSSFCGRGRQLSANMLRKNVKRLVWIAVSSSFFCCCSSVGMYCLLNLMKADTLYAFLSDFFIVSPFVCRQQPFLLWNCFLFFLFLLRRQFHNMNYVDDDGVSLILDLIQPSV